MKDVAIIGGGIIGLALAYELSVNCSDFKVTIYEKESKLGKHQSGNNSGVLHCGLHYKPGSLKANLAVEGIHEMVSFSKKNKINYDLCGKIVIASDDREVMLLNDLASRGKKNGLNGLQFINKEKLRLREPNVKSKKTLLVPEEGIIDYNQVLNVMADYIQNSGGELKFNNKVSKISSFKNNSIVVMSEKSNKEYDLIINCTGLYSDRTYKGFTNKKSPVKIIPFRGEYMKIAEKYSYMFNHLIYPVPDPKFPFLGVHFTRMTNGNREVGPNAVLA